MSKSEMKRLHALLDAPNSPFWGTPAGQEIKALREELALARQVIEAARKAAEFLPGSSTIKPGRSAHVDASAALRSAIAAYDALKP